MSFFENTRKPVGLGGKLMVAMMNLGHTPVATWGLEFLHLSPDAKVLDCGCGGGANMKRLLRKCPRGVVKGIDYSPVSVQKARSLNQSAIQEGRCVVWQGSVEQIIFAKDWFDAVTAFETVYFWPDLPQCFPGGLPGAEARRDISHLQREQRRHRQGRKVDRDHRRHDHLQGRRAEDVSGAGGLSRGADTQKEKLAVHHGTEMRGLNHEHFCIHPAHGV